MLCPICNNTAILWYKLKQYRMFKCTICGHGTIIPKPTKEALNKYYSKDYAKAYLPNNNKAKQRMIQYKLDLALIKKYLPHKNIKVLDYGCSTGLFLDIMPNAWIKHGYEVNLYEKEYVNTHYNNITAYSDIKQIKKKYYDLIVLRGVIEHVIELDTVMKVIKNSLKKDGIVYITATPDFNSPCSVLYGPDWNQIAVPSHCHQFTAASLSFLFGKYRFGTIAMEYQYLNTPYANNKDMKTFISNLNRKKPINTNHAYPGTMISMIFKKVK